MKRRKKAKIITHDEFLSKQQGNFVSCDIEDVLCKDYVYLLDSMDMEDFEYHDTSFDIFKEIVYKNKVVGFVSYMNEGGFLNMMESYIMPEYRDKDLLIEEFKSQKDLTINNPQISIVKSLIEDGLAFELEDGIVVSQIHFNVSSYQMTKKIESSKCYAHVYDLNYGSVLILENPENFNYSKPNFTDPDKIDLKDGLDDEYLKKAYEIVSDYDKKYLKVSYRIIGPTIIFV